MLLLRSEPTREQQHNQDLREIYSYFERSCRKNVHTTMPKGDMGWDQYIVFWHCSCRTYFFWLSFSTRKHTSMASRAILSNHVLSRTVNSKLPTIPFGIIACTFSDNFLKITVQGGKNSRINRFLPECIAFNQTLRHYLPEWISPQTTQIKTRGSSVSFAVQTLSFLCGKFSSARLEILPNLRYAGIFQMSTTVNLEIELTRPGVKLDE